MYFKKRFLGLIIAASMSFGAVSAFAADGGLEKISAFLSKGVTIKIDGNTFEPKDANGKVVYPINYNGTTYLPIRAVGSAFGKAIDWDGNTGTVFVGEKEGKGIDLITLKEDSMESHIYWGKNNYSKIFKTVDQEILNIKKDEHSGVTYKSGIYFKREEVEWGNALYTLNKKYQKIIRVLASKSLNVNIIFTDLETGIQLINKKLSDKETKEISLDIGSVNKLKISFSGDDGAEALLADAYLK